jgi:hypothetical protein
MMRFGQMRHGSASRLEQPLAPVGSQGAAAFWCSDSNKTNPVVMPGLVPGIQTSASTRACGTMDPGDKHRDDTGLECR